MSLRWSSGSWKRSERWSILPFALDVFTIIQQDYLTGDQGSTLSDIELVELG